MTAPRGVWTSGGSFWISLATLAVVPFVTALYHPLFADDYIHLERAWQVAREGASALKSAWILNASDSGVWWAPGELELRYLRPLATLAFVLDRSLYGLSAWGYHLTSLLLHVANTLLVAALARNFLAARGAWLAALLFAIHPCHAEAVLWASARADLLATLFVLAAFLLELRARSAGVRGLWLRSMSLVCFGLALASKESAAIYPLLLVLHELLMGRDEPRRARLFALLPPALLLAVYLVLRLVLLAGFPLPPHPFAHAPGDPDWLAAALLAPLYYLLDLVLFIPPDPLVMEPFWREHRALFAAAALVALLLFAHSLRGVRDRPLRDFAVGFIVIALAPVLLIAAGERFLYLPSVGYCLLLAARLGEAPAQRLKVTAVAFVVVLVACGRTLVFGEVAALSRQAIDDASRAVAAAPAARAVLVIDLPAVSVLGFPAAMRLEHPGRGLDVEIVTLTPAVLSQRDSPRSRVLQQGPGRYRLITPEPLWSSYLARAFRAPRQGFQRHEQVSRQNFALLVDEVKDAAPSELVLDLGPAAAHTLLLQGNGLRLSTLHAPSH